MRKNQFTKQLLVIALTTILISGLLTNSAKAIENGSEAIANEIVVPIFVGFGNDKGSSCSGALINPYVVVMAGHCLEKPDGQMSTDVLVGPPGSPNVYNSATWVNASEVLWSIDYQGSLVGNKVNSSDIGFLTLSKSFPQSNRILFPSETQLLNIKNTNAKLRLIGYGLTNDTVDRSIFAPQFVDASYSSRQGPDLNSGFAVSTPGGTCSGDSGGPVLNITPSRVFLVGIITGGAKSKNCSKKDSDGNFYTLFTLVNRFGNLLGAADANAIQSGIRAQAELSSKLSAANQSLSDAQSATGEAESKLESKIKEIADLKSQLAAFKATGLRYIVCVSGVKTKSVVAANPKCPLGYKKK
jgi:secreted trypsin-like serine protease